MGFTLTISATLPGMWDRTISIGSAGKTFSMTGWKVQSMITSIINQHVHLDFLKLLLTRKSECTCVCICVHMWLDGCECVCPQAMYFVN